VRGVQVHNKTLEKCVTGERSAINLMDIDNNEITPTGKIGVFD